MLCEKGRPSKSKQLEIERMLRPYFARTLSASFVANETGFNIKTVCRYFDKWSNEIRGVEDQDFFSRQRKQRDRIILSYDDLIFQEYEMLGDIKDQIKKYKEKEKEIPRFFVNSFQDVVKTISNLQEKKCSFSLQPLPEELIEQKIQEKLGAHGLNK